jgi:hypothetical protein
MADDADYGSEAEEETEETQVLQPGKDYEALAPDSNFKAIEKQIWDAYDKAYLSVPEDEREGEAEDWADGYAEENALDKNRVLTVVKLGIFGGARDEFNQRTGEGQTIHPNGDTFVGQYWEGKRNGKGTYVFKSLGMSEVPRLISAAQKSKSAEESNEDFTKRIAKYLTIGEQIVEMALQYGFFPVYSGQYVNDMRHGQGVMINKDGTVYIGQWLNNKRHGNGTYYYLNGDSYSGEWVQGRKHGSGNYSFAKQKCEYFGQWEADKIIRGDWRLPNGVYYSGAFDPKNQPGDADSALHFPSLDMVVRGDFQTQQWTPQKDLLTDAQYTKLQESAHEGAEGEQGEEGAVGAAQQ